MLCPNLISQQGDRYGLGEVRRHELMRACGVVGLSQSRVVIIDHPQLQVCGRHKRAFLPGD